MKKGYKRTRFFHKFSKITILGFMMLQLIFLDVVLTKIIKKYSINKKKPFIGTKHPYYHHTLLPNSSYERYIPLRSELSYQIFTNSLGFKDSKNREVEKSTEDYRIIFIGDSFTEGVWLNWEDTFVGMISDSLSKFNMEILNAGVSSYSPSICYKKIKYLIEVDSLAFDEVIVFLDISDPQDEYNYHFRSDEQITQDVGSWTANTKEGKFVSLKSTVKKILQKHTTVFFFLTDMLHDFFHYNDTKNLDAFSMDFVRDKWTIDKKIFSEFADTGIDIMISNMNLIKNLLDEYNIKLKIAVYPWPSQIWYGDYESMHVKIWKEWCEKNNLEFYNFFPFIFFEEMTENEKIDIIKKYYIKGDIHFNKTGNRLIADRFLEFYDNVKIENYDTN